MSKDIEAQQKLRYSYNKKCAHVHISPAYGCDLIPFFLSFLLFIFSAVQLLRLRQQMVLSSFLTTIFIKESLKSDNC